MCLFAHLFLTTSLAGNALIISIFDPPPSSSPLFRRWVRVFVFNVASISCYTAYFDFVDNLVVQTLFPIGCTFAWLLIWALHKSSLQEVEVTNQMLGFGGGDDEYGVDHTSRGDEDANDHAKRAIITLENIDEKYFTVFLFFTYVILVSVTTTIFQAFPCVNTNPDNVQGLSDGGLYLAADMSIECDSPRYNFGVTWAAAMIIIYPVGISVSKM